MAPLGPIVATPVPPSVYEYNYLVVHNTTLCYCVLLVNSI